MWCKTTVSLVGHKLKLNETQVELDLAPNLPHVKCDASQIQQVILNLVLECGRGDAGAAGRPGRSPSGRALRATAWWNCWWRTTAKASLRRISRKIFDPFFTTKPEGKGVGLGLAVVYGIIQAHDGDIEVKARWGRGRCLPFRCRCAGEAVRRERACEGRDRGHVRIGRSWLGEVGPAVERYVRELLCQSEVRRRAHVDSGRFFRCAAQSVQLGRVHAGAGARGLRRCRSRDRPDRMRSLHPHADVRLRPGAAWAAGWLW